MAESALTLFKESIEPKEGHEPILKRDRISGTPVIRVTCTGCKYHAVWMPDETTRFQVGNWNKWKEHRG